MVQTKEQPNGVAGHHETENLAPPILQQLILNADTRIDKTKLVGLVTLGDDTCFRQYNSRTFKNALYCIDVSGCQADITAHPRNKTVLLKPFIQLAISGRHGSSKALAWRQHTITKRTGVTGCESYTRSS